MRRRPLLLALAALLLAGGCGSDPATPRPAAPRGGLEPPLRVAASGEITAIAGTPQGVYVMVSDSSQETAELKWVDAARRVTRIAAVGHDPIAMTVLRGRVWVSDGGLDSGTLRAVDPVSGRVVRSVRLPAESYDLETGGGRVWAFAQDGRVFAVDPRGGSPPVTFRLGTDYDKGAVGLGALYAGGPGVPVLRRALQPDGRLGPARRLPEVNGGLLVAARSVWAADIGDSAAPPPALRRLDPRTGKVRARFPYAQELAAGGSSIWLARNNLVQRIDTARNRTVGAPVAVGPPAAEPLALAYGAGRLWITHVQVTDTLFSLRP